jgi:hypothetical protein
MKDATSALRLRYTQLLSGLTFDGIIVPVYSDEVNDTVEPFTRDDPPRYYIILSNQNQAQADNNKSDFKNTYSIQVDCIAQYPPYNGSFLKAEQLTEQLKEIIMPDVQADIDIPGYTSYKTTCNSFNLSEKTKVQNIFRRITIFNHLLKEN